MKHRTAILACTLIATAGLCWLLRPAAGIAEPGAQAQQGHVGRLLQTSLSSTTSASRPAVVEDSSWDPLLVRRMEQKYHDLLSNVQLQPGQLAQLRELLLQQEELRGMIKPSAGTDPELNQIQRAAVELDARIRVLLGPKQYANYEALRDSAVEQLSSSQCGSNSNNLPPGKLQQGRLIRAARPRHEQCLHTSRS